MRALLSIALLWVAVASTAAATPSLHRLHRLQGRTMGTTWQVTLAIDGAGHPGTLREGIQGRLDEVVAQMSTWEPESDISRFNRAPAGTVQALPEGFFRVLDAALRLARDSGGAFDPTVGPLVDLWGFGPDGTRNAPPGEAEIEALRAHTGWQRLRLDANARTATQPGGMRIDLSSIAKGYAVDRVADYLDGHGVDAYLVEVGGELRARGRKPGSQPWRIGVERPAPDDRGDGDAPALSDVVVEMDGLSMATSGDYRHFFESGDTRYSHTIDPRSGRPVTHALASVTVLHADCMQADALATTLDVMGPEAGFAYAEARGLAALFFVREGGTFVERMTPAFRARIARP